MDYTKQAELAYFGSVLLTFITEKELFFLVIIKRNSNLNECYLVIDV